jgi:hypothetical protein
MHKIVLIGAGQIGSRHLQGLKRADLNMSVFVVDTNQQSLETAKKRYEEIEHKNHIESIAYLTSIDLLPPCLDLAIISTGSIPRTDLTRCLLSSRKVENIVFEKFLFPSVSDYSSIEKELNDHKTRAWVNCTRRHFSFYKEMKKLLADSTSMEMRLTGSNWGLACNSIHFIDLFAMLTGRNDFEINTSMLEKIIDSKRPGYVEFIGAINGKSLNDNNYCFSLTSGDDCGDLLLCISTEKYKITILEPEGKAYIEFQNGEKTEKEVKINYQSELTGMMAEQIILDHKSDLPAYSESADLHLRFLKPVMEFYNRKTGNNADFCPIT